MVLNINQYDAGYYGDVESDLKRKSGYSNYLEQQSQALIQKRLQTFLDRYNIPKNAKILELGAGCGHLAKLARENGYTNWIAVDWSAWCQANKVFDSLIKQDALSYLQTQPDNSFDYIISRALVECFSANDLVKFLDECSRVGTNQIHDTFPDPNPNYYNKVALTSVIKKYG